MHSACLVRTPEQGLSILGLAVSNLSDQSAPTWSFCRDKGFLTQLLIFPVQRLLSRLDEGTSYDMVAEQWGKFIQCNCLHLSRS